ncbi:MAG: MmgE/PrpD family protein [Pseudomonadota bacterium]|nr:MmgE/PrpD family protein [Pseudomonadota bacterium]
MPNIAEQLAAYAAELSYDDLPAEVVHQTKRTILDTVGCAFGGFDSGPGLIRFRLRDASVRLCSALA